MERPSVSFAVASVAFLALSPTNASVAIVGGLLFGKVSERLGRWGTAALSTVISFAGAYFGLPWLAMLGLLGALYRYPEVSFAALPFSLLGSYGAVVVSPLLGAYPSSVKAGLPPWLPPVTSLPQCLELGGGASPVGYAFSYVFLWVIDKLGQFLPNQPMVKLSEPIFVGIGAGIMINVVRVRVRLAQGIKLKLKARHRGPSY